MTNIKKSLMCKAQNLFQSTQNNFQLSSLKIKSQNIEGTKIRSVVSDKIKELNNTRFTQDISADLENVTLSEINQFMNNINDLSEQISTMNKTHGTEGGREDGSVGITKPTEDDLKKLNSSDGTEKLETEGGREDGSVGITKPTEDDLKKLNA